MKDLLVTFLKGYAFMAGWTLALVAITVLLLFSSGSLTTEKTSAAWTVLQEGAPPPQIPVPEGMEKEWRKLQKSRARAKETLDRRREDLRRLDVLTADRLARIEKELAELEKRRAEVDREAAALKERKDAAAAADVDAELEANLPIFAKLDGASLLDLMKGWEDERIVRYLRALKASKAAEVLEAMRADPAFEAGFRMLKKGAPPGTLTRAERIMEEFKKTPK